MEKCRVPPDLLQIFIFTRNRADYLRETLASLTDALNASITVIDNASTDETPVVVSQYANGHDSRVLYIKNSHNIGAGASLLKAFELASSRYVWILGDDDSYDFAFFSDLLDDIDSIQPRLAHVGAHPEPWIHGGMYQSPRLLMSSGYSFFKYSSFIGCNIIDREYFSKYCIEEAYRSIHSGYPHMPYACHIFLRDEPVLLSRTRIVTAVIGNQGYTDAAWICMWAKALLCLQDKTLVRTAFFDHFSGRLTPGVINLLRRSSRVSLENKVFLRSFVSIVFRPAERLALFVMPPYALLVSIRKLINTLFCQI
jgi:glycosyltransferase involved in cell wall biosynthesis